MFGAATVFGRAKGALMAAFSAGDNFDILTSSEISSIDERRETSLSFVGSWLRVKSCFFVSGSGNRTIAGRGSLGRGSDDGDYGVRRSAEE